METDITTDQKNKPEEEETITLSAALLAPLNSIFEAQIHAARAFLSFILQMGFRHVYSNEEIEELMKNPQKYDKILKEIEDKTKDTERIKELETKKKSSESLTPDELDEFKYLLLKCDDLYRQEFNYFNDKGDVSRIYIPNLALLPVKPLAVNNANFKFDIKVTNYSEKFNQMGNVDGADKDRPWFLIKPKTIRGEFSSGESKDKNIQVEINLNTTEIPYGLDKLLTSLTNDIAVAKKIDIKKE